MSEILYTGGYVRHRGRMVARSVYQDARRVTDATGWTAEPTVGLIDEPVTFIDFFPQGREATAETLASNTLAIDLGTAGAEVEWEMGGLFAQEYVFSLAMNAVSDAVAMALFSDLGDRYTGRTEAPYITLYNFAVAPPVEVVRMEVELFEFAKSTEEVAPGVHLFFARLVLTDYIEQAGP